MERLRRDPLYLDALLYGLSAAFAVYTAVWSTLPAHRFWGAVVLGGYVPATIVSVLLWNRYGTPVRLRLWVAVGTGAAVTGMPLLAEVAQRAQGVAGRAQDEVLVVEDSGVRLWETGTPYLTDEVISALPVPLLGYDPYQPGMALFGLPRAWFGEAWFTDARIYFALVTVAAVWWAVRLLRDAGMPVNPTVRAIQAVFVVPVCALTLATGGDDLPVVAACVLALAAMAVGRPVLAGVAIGVAAALKLFAWPVLVVVAVLAWRRGELRRFAPAAAGIPVLAMVPALVADAGAFYDNVIGYPLGQGVVKSTAASPLPGHLIAEHVPGGGIIAMMLLASAAAGFAVYLWRTPVTSAHHASAVCAVGLTVAMCLLPASRFGYLLYPAVFGIWWWVLREAESPRSPWRVENGAQARR
ncbi:uncharacterized protein DUF2029 [Stackebrandtia albiflava]|uniref:Uncharacterized protein DUF2029 n=1 Tax=Stackebrandtia albiflava TaxID=406432 RepID=A0A562V0Y5_9ACTN|nr:glycosyltransferase 87 family protein [Stackebrandtia albiflava]TWJ11534.1 uncharacterized protein DUF2029 [Stackebrandtia albiflava]